MKHPFLAIENLGQLKTSVYISKSIKDEMRDNLIGKLQSGSTIFEGIIGYENTVLPEIERAILSKHTINFLGLRGQAKTRMARLMTQLLDEYVPIVQGSEINDDPLAPLSFYAKELIAEKGDQTPISWLHRDERFVEKLATPDVTVADLIGDVDPIKAANLKLNYADERVIHFGMIPRANRCIFVINEIPDLQARIQVALFNILQEGDIQIRGFKLRFPLDMQFVFTANPEDYTNRGSIVTPLKDRIGSQILTHYPNDIQTARQITQQEVVMSSIQNNQIFVPELAQDLIEYIVFAARESSFVDAKSGVSARLGITAFQNLLSTTERRLLINHEEKTTVRLTDFHGIIPAITGKIELVYEGEQEGSVFVAHELIDEGIKNLFITLFPKIEKLEHKNVKGVYDDLLEWFFNANGIEIFDLMTDADYKQVLDHCPPLDVLINEFQPNIHDNERYFIKELLIWGLCTFEKLSKDRFSSGLKFNDLYGSYINKL
jgi:magnesium chelatase subunit I